MLIDWLNATSLIKIIKSLQIRIQILVVQRKQF